CQGYAVEVAQDGEEVIAAFENSALTISAVILDVTLPRKDGIEALKEIRRSNRITPIIMIAGTALPMNIVDAMRSGANDFLAKPIHPEDLRRALKTALGTNLSAVPKSEEQRPLDKQVFFGTNAEMRELQKLIGPIGWSEAPVL